MALAAAELAVGPLFRSAAFLMARARAAYRSVLTVSSRFESAGETHATMSVWLDPPSESCRMRVNFESRYGTCASPEPSAPLLSARTLMTLPRASKPLLI